MSHKRLKNQKSSWRWFSDFRIYDCVHIVKKFISDKKRWISKSILGYTKKYSKYSKNILAKIFKSTEAQAERRSKYATYE